MSNSVVDVPRKGEIYQHYKGGYYLVEGIARHSETGEHMVIYRNLYHKSPVPTDEPVEADRGIAFGQLNCRPLIGEGGWSTPVEEDFFNIPPGTRRFELVDFKVWP